MDDEIVVGDKPKRKGIRYIYDKKYKALLIIPFLLLILAIAQIGWQVAATGDFLNKGVSLKGGLTISVMKPTDIHELETHLNEKFPAADISVRALSQAGKQIGITIDASDIDSEPLLDEIQAKLGKLEQGEYSVEVMGSSLGASFFKETIRAVIIAFVLMGIVVFIYFRVPIPSIAVILAAVSDIIVTLAIVNILGIKLSTAGIAAFLMLIGYSVDTDILLSTRVLKRKSGTPLDGTISAMKTGIIMTITTCAAVTIALVFSQSIILKQIMLILLIGLLVDLPNTWLQNAGILRWYLERKQRKREQQNV